MIAVDSSALICVALRERGWEEVFPMLDADGEMLISAVTLAETLIVGARRQVSPNLPAFLATLGLTVVPLDAAGSARAAAVYDRFGKGVHPAALNFVDCFSYDVAHHNNCPLLYVGNDFGRTDIVSALPR